MSIRTYDHNKYTKELKQYIRNLVSQVIQTTNIEYPEYFLPNSIAIIEFYGPMIFSYVQGRESDFSLSDIEQDKEYKMVISQMILTRIINLFVIKMRSKQITIDISETENDLIKEQDGYPYGLYTISEIIPSETCRLMDIFLSNLLPETETKDVKFSLTNKDEEWGDIPPEFVSCLNTSLYNDLMSKGFEVCVKKLAVYSKYDKINITCSNEVMNRDMIMIFLKDAVLFGKECITYGKKITSQFKTNVKAGTILIFKRDAYYKWSYSLSDNNSVLILK
jgi:hypothetical protein